MNLSQAFILSVIEGLTEFLPISSTGHMTLASAILKIAETDFVKSFEIIIQSGAILAVVALYLEMILKNKELLKKTIIAFIPTGIIGLVLYKVIKNYLIGNSLVTVMSLLVGGILLIFFELHFKKKTQEKDLSTLSYKNAFFIGLFQSFSIIPGVSRAAATIIGGLFTGLTRSSAVEFSFILAIPTMLAATGLDLAKSAHSFSFSQIEILIFGFVVSFIVALAVIKWMLYYIKRYTFIPFGIYRIIAAIIFFLVFLK